MGHGPGRRDSEYISVPLTTDGPCCSAFRNQLRCETPVEETWGYVHEEEGGQASSTEMTEMTELRDARCEMLQAVRP